MVKLSCNAQELRPTPPFHSLHFFQDNRTTIHFYNTLHVELLFTLDTVVVPHSALEFIVHLPHYTADTCSNSTWCVFQHFAQCTAPRSAACTARTASRGLHEAVKAVRPDVVGTKRPQLRLAVRTLDACIVPAILPHKRRRVVVDAHWGLIVPVSRRLATTIANKRVHHSAYSSRSL